jgi:hypothetical protein
MTNCEKSFVVVLVFPTNAKNLYGETFCEVWFYKMVCKIGLKIN